MFERDEVAAAHARRDDLLANFVEEEGPLETPCWIWQRSCIGKPDGYGQVFFKGFQYSTHRLMWVYTHGPIPTGLLVRHRCHRPPCFRLDHLLLGTYVDNMRDMSERLVRELEELEEALGWGSESRDRRLRIERYHQERGAILEARRRGGVQ